MTQEEISDAAGYDTYEELAKGFFDSVQSEEKHCKFKSNSIYDKAYSYAFQFFVV